MSFIKKKENNVAHHLISVANYIYTILAAGMNDEILHLTYNLATISDSTEQFWQALKGYTIFAFSGEMSAGKTTFIHSLCDYLRVEDTVSSPTFSLINEYHFQKEGKDCIIYHMDWYRLKNAQEAMNAGIEDCLLQAKQKKAYCFIEWPEKAQELIPSPHLWLSIETTSVQEREMKVRLIQ